MRFNRRALLLLAACAALAGGAGRLAAQTAGSVRGKVVEGSTLRPLAGVQVTVPGTGRGALSDAGGNYLINNVPVGAQTVRADMLGYSTVQHPTTVTVGQTAVVDFQLTQTVLALNELVVTGVPGATSKRTLGNSITKLDAADLTDKTTVTNVVELLQAKTPGLQLLPNAGVPGTSSDIRIRGAGSLSLSNTPLVYVDGVRYNTSGYGSFVPSGSGGINYRGQSTSALDGIDPSDIESIEVIKGPAAATLYGPEAAPGVIQIITKKGKIGQQALQWNARLEYGANQMGLAFPDNITTCDQYKFGVNAANVAKGQAVTWPGCVGKAPGTQLVENRINTDPNAFRNGPVRKVSITARGGGDNFSYYIAGDFDDQNGVQYSSENLRRSVRANFQLNPTNKVDFSLSTNYARSWLRLPLGDESAEGMMWSYFRGRPGMAVSAAVGCDGTNIYCSRDGWGGTAPIEANAYNNQTWSDRITLGGTLNYRPLEWLKHRVTLGLDYTGSLAQILSPPGSVDADYAGYRDQGIVRQRAPRTYVYTAEYVGNVDKRVGDNLLFTTSLGAQANMRHFEQVNAWGFGFGSPDVTLIGSAAQPNGSNDYSETKGLGLFGQEQIGWKDRLYLTGAIRVDNSSVFGENINRYIYPKASLSWVASDEPGLRPFFERMHVDNFKFRTAWGAAGRAPNPYAWTQTYTITQIVQANGSIGSALITSGIGNPDLKPERGSEIEVGFESALLSDRAAIDFTYYRKNMSDVLMALSAPPSSGFTSTLWRNLGETLNQGFEVSLRGTPILRKTFTWDLGASLATNSNKLVKFGTPLVKTMTPSGQSYGAVQQHREGYPLAGYWAPLPKRNEDGSLVLNAQGVAVADTASYIGPSAPTRNVSLFSTLTILRNFRVFGLVDYAGGFYNFDYKWRVRCLSYGNCAQMNDPANVDLTNLDWNGTYGPKAVAKNADLVAILRSGVNGYYVQPADYIKLRDLSLTYTVPNKLLRGGIRGLSLTGAVHNIGILWTRYSGIDPEVNSYGDVSYSRGDVYAIPMARRVTVSANVSF